MVKTFSISDEKEINDYLDECAKDVSASVTIVGNAKEGNVIVQVDRETEKASVIQSLLKARAQMILDRVTDSNRRVFLKAQEKRMRDEQAKKTGGTGKRDNLAAMIAETEKNISEVDARLFANEFNLTALKESIKDIKAGKADDLFVK